MKEGTEPVSDPPFTSKGGGIIWEFVNETVTDFPAFPEVPPGDCKMSVDVLSPPGYINQYVPPDLKTYAFPPGAAEILPKSTQITLSEWYVSWTSILDQLAAPLCICHKCRYQPGHVMLDHGQYEHISCTSSPEFLLSLFNIFQQVAGHSARQSSNLDNNHAALQQLQRPYLSWHEVSMLY